MSTADQTRQPPLAEKLRALRDPASYPITSPNIEAVETHFAWVFLTDRYAYKLKKPVQVARMDHTRLDARRRSCLEELRLNRRLAPAVYLDVVALTSGEAGKLRIEQPGIPVEWLVKMRRLPQSSLLDHAIKAHTVTRAAVRKVATLLSEFYCEQPPIDIDGAEYVERLTNEVNADRAELLAEDLRPQPELVRAVVLRQLEFLGTHGQRVAERARHRKIIEAHGDLKPEHVYIGDPPCVIDRLEFDRDLRILDPLEELAFISMECDRADAAWIGEEMVHVYLAASRDTCAPDLFDFYLSHRAAHRAMISAWHLRDAEVRDGKDWRALAETYLRLALRYMRN